MDYSIFENHKVVPVVVINDINDTITTLDAMQKGGVMVAEITFRTSCAKEAIALASKECKDMLIGAGTVINKTQCEDAISAGAKFIVSPGFSETVCDVCQSKDIPYFPGCVTPTEIMMAVAKGLEIIKFFPASVYGGLKAIKSLAAPFPQIKFIPTGGVDAQNLAEFLHNDKIFAVGGSWMMSGSTDDITAKCKEVCRIVKEI